MHANISNQKISYKFRSHKTPFKSFKAKKKRIELQFKARYTKQLQQFAHSILVKENVS